MRRGWRKCRESFLLDLVASFIRADRRQHDVSLIETSEQTAIHAALPFDSAGRRSAAGSSNRCVGIRSCAHRNVECVDVTPLAVSVVNRMAAGGAHGYSGLAEYEPVLDFTRNSRVSIRTGAARCGYVCIWVSGRNVVVCTDRISQRR